MPILAFFSFFFNPLFLPQTLSPTTFPEFVKQIFNLAIIVSGLFALGVLVWAGILYLISAGDPKKIEQAKKKAFGAFLGLIILLSSYLILKTIHPQLVILKLKEIVLPKSKAPPLKELMPSKTFSFQEIPLGILIENILGKQISCFNEQGDLVDCQKSECFPFSEGKFICYRIGKGIENIIEVVPEKIKQNPFSTSSHWHYCYQYDSQGNKESLLEYRDRFDCIANLISALEEKIKALMKLVEELQSDFRALTTKSKQLKDLAEACSCENCKKECSCSADCKDCFCQCQDWEDLCSDRERMDSLRKEIRELIEKIEKKRIEIYDLIFGADVAQAEKEDQYEWYQTIVPDLANLTWLTYYLKEMDPNFNSKFLSLKEGERRLKEFIEELERDLQDLERAEGLMKDPYGDRAIWVELGEFIQKVAEVSGNEVELEKFKGPFGEYSIIKYCRSFNCVEKDKQGLCQSCQLTKGRICEKENFDADGLTFYFNDELLRGKLDFKELGIVERECEINFEEKEKEIFVGLIPIGEIVDEAEKFASSTISILKEIFNEIEGVEMDALGIVSQATSSTKAAWALIDFTSHGENPNEDCLKKCTQVPCSCECYCFQEELSGICECIAFCQGNPCPFSKIDSASKEIEEAYNNFLNLWASLLLRQDEISGYHCLLNFLVSPPINYEICFRECAQTRKLDRAKKVILEKCKIPSACSGHQKFEEDERCKKLYPNRCSLFDKLILSRKKVDKMAKGKSKACLPLIQSGLQPFFLSCPLAMDAKELKLVEIQPQFPYPPDSSCVNCYPYNAENSARILSAEEKKECLENRHGEKCINSIRDLMPDYYCCIGRKMR